MYALIWMKLENDMLHERSPSQHITYCMFHLHEIPRTEKSAEIESSLVVA